MLPHRATDAERELLAEAIIDHVNAHLIPWLDATATDSGLARWMAMTDDVDRG